MSLRKKTKSESEKPSHLDRLIDLRNDITGSDGLTQLLDILIDNEGGDSQALADERAANDENVTTSIVDTGADDNGVNGAGV